MCHSTALMAAVGGTALAWLAHRLRVEVGWSQLSSQDYLREDEDAAGSGDRI